MKSDLSTKTLIYLRAAELVEQGHCKDALARTADGRGVYYDSKDAIAWCYVGAICKAAEEFSSAVPYFHAAFPGRSAADWNNAPDTTAAMVAQKLREQAFT